MCYWFLQSKYVDILCVVWRGIVLWSGFVVLFYFLLKKIFSKYFILGVYGFTLRFF